MNTKFKAATMLAAAGAIVAGALGAAGPANAQYDKFVAISYSPESGVFGSGRAASMDSARIQSLAQCQDRGGNHCVFVAWAQDGCAAVALKDWQLPGREQYYGWFGRTFEDAKAGALARNGGGYIASYHCSAG